MIEAIIFDLEGVVIDSEPLWSKADEEFLKRHNLPYKDDEWKPKLMGLSLVDGAGLYKERYGFSAKVEELARQRREIARELFSQELSFIDGFELFHTKIARQCKTAVATGLERDFLTDLDRRFGLSLMFKDHVYTIDDIGRISKPNPDIFLFAAKKLRSNPRYCVVIEDSPNGVEAAKRAGMFCVALTTTSSRDKLSKADLIFDSYSQVEVGSLLK